MPDTDLNDRFYFILKSGILVSLVGLKREYSRYRVGAAFETREQCVASKFGYLAAVILDAVSKTAEAVLDALVG